MHSTALALPESGKLTVAHGPEPAPQRRPINRVAGRGLHHHLMCLRSGHAAPVPRRGVTHGEASMGATPTSSVVDHGDRERHAITAVELELEAVPELVDALRDPVSGGGFRVRPWPRRARVASAMPVSPTWGLSTAAPRWGDLSAGAAPPPTSRREGLKCADRVGLQHRAEGGRSGARGLPRLVSVTGARPSPSPRARPRASPPTAFMNRARRKRTVNLEIAQNRFHLKRRAGAERRHLLIIPRDDRALQARPER